MDDRQGRACRKGADHHGDGDADEPVAEPASDIPNERGAPMRNENSMPRTIAAHRKAAGFSMIEMMIAMSVFLIIGGVAMSLFRQNTRLYTDQTNTVALNVTLRNALTQI